MTLRADGLTLQINHKVLLENLHICFQPGEIWGILGCNGSGKTSLLHTLAGLLRPQQGQIYLAGKNLNSFSARKRARHIALLWQDYEDMFPTKVIEAVMMGRYPYAQWGYFETHQDRQFALHALKQLALENLQDRDVSTLSGGERRRLAIAATLAQNSPYFLLDEPTNHLDLKYQMHVLNLFKQQAKQFNKTIIMALHDVNQAYQFCDAILGIVSPDEVLQGDKATIMTAANLTRLYQHPIRTQQQEQHLFFYPLPQGITR
jgi:iron complex transport system ATP-binding protein